MSKNFKLILAIFYIAILVFFLYVLFSNLEVNRLNDFVYYKELQRSIENFVFDNLFYNILLFSLFSIIWVSLLGFGSPLLIISGIFFGKWIGTILIAISLSIGSLILYLITIFFLKDLIHQKLENKMVFLKELFKKNEFLYFLTYRFIGGIPFFIANTLPVIFNVKIKNYFLGTLIGMIPQLFIMVSIGSGLEKIIDANSAPPTFFEIILSKDIYLPLVAFLLIVIISFFLKKKLYK